MDSSPENLEMDTNDKEKSGYFTFIVRILKTKEGTLKGYLVDPFTNSTYPMLSVPDELARDDLHTKIISDFGFSEEIIAGYIKSLGCWVGLWKTMVQESEKENNV